MENLEYLEVKEMLLEDFNDFISEEGYTAEQAIAALLEDSIRIMKNNRSNYISVFIVLSFICLKHNMIPEYIYERLCEIITEELIDYPYINHNDFLKDKSYIGETLEKQNYIVSQDKNFRNRLDLLLG